MEENSQVVKTKARKHKSEKALKQESIKALKGQSDNRGVGNEWGKIFREMLKFEKRRQVGEQREDNKEKQFLHVM